MSRDSMKLVVGRRWFLAVWAGTTCIVLPGAVSAYLVSTGSLGSLTLGPSDTVGFNTDTGEYAINGGPPIPGGVEDPNGAMVFNFTTINLQNTTAIFAYGSAPLALAASGPVVINGTINLRGCSPTVCGVVVVASGGKAGTSGNLQGVGGKGGGGGSKKIGWGGPGGNGGNPQGANGGGGGGGGGGYARQPGNGGGGPGFSTGGGGGGEGGETGNNGAGGGAVAGGAGGTGGSAGGGDGGNGSANGSSDGSFGWGGTPCGIGGGGGGGGGGAVGDSRGANGGPGGLAGGGGGGGGGTKSAANAAGKGGSGAGASCVSISPFPGIGPSLGGGGGGGAGGKGGFVAGTYAPNGGAGGGAIAIDSLHSITFLTDGRIDARGGDAGSPGSMGDGGGGGGGGGSILLAAPVVNGAMPGSNLLVGGGTDTFGGLGGTGVVAIERIAACDPDDDVVATVPCACHHSGATITFTLENNSGSSIYLPHSGPLEIRDNAGQRVFRPLCTLPAVVEIPAGQSHDFTWDQRDDGNGTNTACQWNDAAQVPDGDYEFAVSFCNDADCSGDQSVRCVDFTVGGCVTVTTDDDCYTPGQNVTMTITNNGCSVINLRNLWPWEIRDAMNNLVYRMPCVAWQIVTLDIGESYSFPQTTWDQLDDGNAQIGCGYQNRVQVPNASYQACVPYTNANFDPDQTVCTTFKIANNCVDVDPECPCNMPGGIVRIGITNRTSEPIGLPHEQPWRIKNLGGAVIYQPSPAGPPVPLNPGQSHLVMWNQQDFSGQPVPSGEYNAEFDYLDMTNTPRRAHGRLQLGGCLHLTIDQDCYAPGADVKVKIVNRACEQIKLTLADRGPLQFVDDQGDPVYALPCVETTTMEAGEMRMWSWNQTDEGNLGTHSNCRTWDNAMQVPNGRYCAQVPYADWPITRAFLAQQCFDIAAGCADLTADQSCYESGDNVCVTLANNTGGNVTVDRVWRILDSNGNEIHPDPPACFIFWIPPVIANGGTRQFCWDQQICFTPPPVGAGDYTFEVHFVEPDGTGHAYQQDFEIVDAGQCTVPPGNIVWDSSASSPDRTTRSLRFRVTGPASPTKVDAIKVTMIDLQTPNPPNLPQFPPPNFSGYESATCAPLKCVGGARNGLTCTVPADCPSPGFCTAAVESNGCARWVGKLGTFLESQDSPGLGSYRAARLQCTPYYWNWKPEGLIAVYGAEIAPSSEYSVQVFGASCKGAEAGCANVSAPVPMFTRRSGDVEFPFVPPADAGQPDVTDIAQLVNKFKNVLGAPVKAVAQLQPNLPDMNVDINALDIVAVVDAVKEQAYAFSGPCPCPSTVPCGMTACASVTPCVNAFGAGATCVKTCVGGANDGEPCIDNTHGHCPGGTCGNPGNPANPGFCRDRCGRCTP